MLMGRQRELNHACMLTYVGTHGKTGILCADKQAMDSGLMYLCSNELKFKQDEKGLHFRRAASLLMTRGPPTTMSAYYNLEKALLCF